MKIISSKKALWRKWSQYEAIMSWYWCFQTRRNQFIQNSQEGSNRGNFKVCFRNWSCIMATFLHILGSYWGCCSFLATEFCLWGGSEITSDTEQHLATCLRYNCIILQFVYSVLVCTLSHVCTCSDLLIRIRKNDQTTWSVSTAAQVTLFSWLKIFLMHTDVTHLVCKCLNNRFYDVQMGFFILSI